MKMSAGRPREPRVDEAVSKAVFELLEEVGYQNTTIQAVARRAGVGAPSIYRRWPNRTQLIEEVIVPELSGQTVVASGVFRADVRHCAEEWLRGVAAPAVRAAVAGLMSDYQHDPDGYDRIIGRTTELLQPAFVAMVEAGQAAGAVSREADPVGLFEVLLGTVWFRAVVNGLDDEAAFLTRVTDIVVAAAEQPVARSLRGRGVSVGRK